MKPCTLLATRTAHAASAAQDFRALRTKLRAGDHVTPRDLHHAVARLRHALHELLTFFPEQHARELLGDAFIGIKETKEAFTLIDDTALWQPNDQEEKEYEQSLARFLAEPDIAAFLKHMTGDPDRAEQLKTEWLLLPLPQTLIDPEPHNRPVGSNDPIPANIFNLYKLLQPDIRARRQGELIANDPTTDVFLYKNYDTFGEPENFVITPSTTRWILIDRESHANTFGKSHNEQTEALTKHATALHLNPKQPLRSTLIETLLAFIVSFRHKESRAMLQKTVGSGNWIPRHWSDTRAADGNLVYLGNAGASGLYVGGTVPAYRGGSVGALLSRRG